MPIAKRDSATFVALHKFVADTLGLPPTKVFLFPEEKLKFSKLCPFVRVHCDPLDIGDDDFHKLNEACKAVGYKFAASLKDPAEAHAAERKRRKERSNTSKARRHKVTLAF